MKTNILMDVIIPIHNDIDQLQQTLNSLFFMRWNLKLYLVFDGCEPEIGEYLRDFSYEIIHTEEEVGPGYARQMGLDKSSSPLIMFLDNGDLLYSPAALQKAINLLLNQNTGYLMYFAQDIQQNGNDYTTIGVENNRLHGKIFKKELFNLYKINFKSENSFHNEDIGFNFQCRLVNAQNNNSLIYFDNSPLTVWTYNPNSVSHRNNNAFYYKEQNMSLGQNSYHAILNSEDNQVDRVLLENHSYYVLVNMYISLLETKAERPEYTDESLAGAKNYYRLITNKFKEVNIDSIITEYKTVIRDIYNNNNISNQFVIKNILYSLIDFLEEIKED